MRATTIAGCTLWHTPPRLQLSNSRDGREGPKACCTPVLLQVLVARKFHLLPFASSYLWSFQRNLLSAKDYISWLFFPNAHRHPWGWADAADLLGVSLPPPGSLAASASRLIRPAPPPAPASPPTLRPSAMALAPRVLALGLPPTCDWTCGLPSDSCFSQRSPIKGIRNPNSIRVRARAAASCSQLSTKPGASSSAHSLLRSLLKELWQSAPLTQN
jgi:hypothetical protein